MSLVMAIGYTNNLIYFFVFFTISICLTTMLVTNDNIDRVLIQDVKAQDLFANEESVVEVTLKNRKARSAWDLSLFFSKTERSSVTQVAAFHETRASVLWVPPHRGEVRLPRLIMESTFPFGLLRAWKRGVLPTSLLVFPERKGQAQFPAPSREARGIDTTGLFREHRSYQSSDSPRRIDWRVVAKQQKLLVRKFETPEKQTLHFNWEQTSSLPMLEDRISQLALWVDLAEQQGHLYSLSIGIWNSEEDQGDEHWRKCMKHLALMTEPS